MLTNYVLKLTTPTLVIKKMRIICCMYHAHMYDKVATSIFVISANIEHVFVLNLAGACIILRAYLTLLHVSFSVNALKANTALLRSIPCHKLKSIMEHSIDSSLPALPPSFIVLSNLFWDYAVFLPFMPTEICAAISADRVRLLVLSDVITCEGHCNHSALMPCMLEGSPVKTIAAIQSFCHVCRNRSASGTIR